MYYILMETQKQGENITANNFVYTDLATAMEAFYNKASYAPKTTADYMGVMLLRDDGAIICPMVSGPIQSSNT